VGATNVDAYERAGAAPVLTIHACCGHLSSFPSSGGRGR
jgi:hypothetical protein